MRQYSTSITIFVPVTITATDAKSLQHVVRELRENGVSHTEDGEGHEHASFKIITKGVKTREVQRQFEALRVRQREGTSGEGESWPFPKNPRREPHPSAHRRKN